MINRESMVFEHYYNLKVSPKDVVKKKYLENRCLHRLYPIILYTTNLEHKNGLY